MSVKVNTSVLFNILERTPASHNILLMGKHGIGKSQILENYYEGKGLKVVTLFLGQMSDPGDLIGIPVKNEKSGKTEFLPPYWFPTDGKPVVLFLDELNRARPEVLQTIMDLALNRKLAGRSLPEGSRIISAVNNGDEYQLTDLDPALVSRFNIYEFIPAVSEWTDWAEAEGIDQRIIDFIKMNPEMLDSGSNTEESESLEKSPDRRSWVRVSEIIKEAELDNVLKSIAAGILGEKAASEFWAFVRKSQKMTAVTLLNGNFEKNLPALNKCSLPDFAALNNGIFTWLESDSFDETMAETVKTNLSLYFNLLLENGADNGRREAAAHFAGMFSGTEYPKTVAFIMMECDGLYSKIMNFVKEVA